MTLDKLGRDRTRLRSRLRPVQQIARAATRRRDPEVRADLAAAHYAGALLGWGEHQTWTPGLGDPGISVLQTMLERAQVFAERSAQGLRATVDLRVPLDTLQRAADVAVDAAIAQGWEVGAEEAAEEAGARYKTWVRVYPVRDPRDWHVDLEGATIAADALFVLPGGPNAGMECDGPHDWDRVDDPGEWIHCGHALIYTDAP